MNLIVIILIFLAFISTLFGGLVILNLKKHLVYFFAFSAGTLIAVAFLDILPESLKMAETASIPTKIIMIIVIITFFIYSLLEKFFLTHHLESNKYHSHIMGPIGALSLIIHSFFDGVIIGSAFQVSSTAGLIIAFAVIFHDFTDGINTVTVMLKNNQNHKKTLIFLLSDALAPVFGILVTSLVTLSPSILAVILACFVGEFLYIGAVSLLPESNKNPERKTMLFTLLGILLILVLSFLL